MHPCEKKLKSLDEHINDIVSKFDYADFKPEINNHSLLQKFKTLFSENNYYWDLYEPEDKWPRWFFIQFVSFEMQNQVRLGLYFNNNNIEYVIFNKFSDPNFTDKHCDGKINLIKTWLEHNFLKKELVKITKKGLEIANPVLTT